MTPTIDQRLDYMISKSDAEIKRLFREQDYICYYMCLAFRELIASIGRFLHPKPGMHEKKR